MTKEDKKLLLVDLCARLPYGVKVFYEYVDDLNKKTYGYSLTLNTWCINEMEAEKAVVKPYLRPMSSMTKEEKEELKKLCEEDLSEFAGFITSGHGLSHDGLYMFDKLRQLEFCLSHHLDFRGMIKKGLALEAPEGMYNLNK